MRMNRLIACVGLLLLAFALTGCGTLPDAKPFADASQTLATSVTSAGQAVADSLGEAAEGSATDAAAYKDLTDRFRTAWAERVAAARAVAAYAESVSDLVSAGKEGGETVKKVGDSLAGLAGALGVPLASPAVGALGDVARFVALQITTVRASDRLETALAQAQPAVDRLAERVALESDQQLRTVLVAAHKNQNTQIKRLYGSEQDQVKQLEVRKLGLVTLALTDATVLPTLLQHDQVLANLRARLAERDRRLDEAASAHKARLQMLNALSTATVTWAQAHRDLAAAVRDKRQVSVANLQATVTELKTLAKKVSEL